MQEKITIKAFGMLAEKLLAPEFDFPFYENSELFLEALKTEYPQLKSLNFSLAVDKKIVHDKIQLKGNEEIALLPPFSGG